MQIALKVFKDELCRLKHIVKRILSVGKFCCVKYFILENLI